MRPRLPASSSGLSFRHHNVIYQDFAGTFEEYFAKISKRALTDLVAIPDGEFEAGIRAMVADLAAKPGPVVEPVDLFVFTKQ